MLYWGSLGCMALLAIILIFTWYDYYK
jgi:hypothetical protein